MVVSPVDKNRDSFQNKKLTFSPKYQNFGVKFVHFCPWSRAGQYFQYDVSLVPRYEGTKSFASSPKKHLKYFGPKTVQFGPKVSFFVILSQILAFLAHLMPCPTKKTVRTRCLGGFMICGYQSYGSLPQRLGLLACKTAKFCPKYALLVILGQILAFLAHLMPCQTTK